jgi:hypothetical protein
MREDQLQDFAPVKPHSPFEDARIRVFQCWQRVQRAREELAEAEALHREAKRWSDELDPKELKP